MNDDGTFVYYNKEGDEWAPADDEVSAYTLEGSLLTTTRTARREDGNGNAFAVSFELTRVKE